MIIIFTLWCSLYSITVFHNCVCVCVFCWVLRRLHWLKADGSIEDVFGDVSREPVEISLERDHDVSRVVEMRPLRRGTEPGTAASAKNSCIGETAEICINEINEKDWKIAFRNLGRSAQMEPNANVRRVKIYTFVSFAMRTLWSGSVLSNWIMVKTVREDTTLACACGVWSGGG